MVLLRPLRSGAGTALRESEVGNAAQAVAAAV